MLRQLQRFLIPNLMKVHVFYIKIKCVLCSEILVIKLIFRLVNYDVL